MITTYTLEIPPEGIWITVCDGSEYMVPAFNVVRNGKYHATFETRTDAEDFIATR